MLLSFPFTLPNKPQPMKALFTAICTLSILALSAQQKLSLRECVDIALENNISVKQSELNTRISEISKNESKLDLLPNLNASGTHGYNWGQTIDPFTNQFATNRVRSNRFGLSSSAVLFSGFQKMNTIEQNKFNFLASEQDLSKVRNDISLSVANGYLQVLLAEKLLTIAEQQVKATKLQYDRIEQLVEVGQLAQNSFLDIKSQLANDELGRISRLNDVQFAKLQLKQLLNLPADQVLAIQDINTDEIEGSLGKLQKSSALFETAVENLPEIKAAEYRLKSAEKGLQIARGGYSPQISVNASYGTGYSGANRQPVGDPVFTGNDVIGFTETTGENVVAPRFAFDEFQTKSFNDQLADNVNKSVSVSLVIPLFNGNKTRNGAKRSEINTAISRLSVDNAKNVLRQDIERSHNDAVAALKSYEASSNAFEASQLSFANAEARFAQNLINASEFEDIKTRFVSAQNELARAKFTYLFRLKVLQFYNGEAL